MHPLFKSRSAMAAYASLWVVLALLLAALLRLAGSATWTEALLLSGPPCVFYAFMCLTPWYVCRALPLSSAVWRLAVNHVGAAVLACALWIGAARGVASLVARGGKMRLVASPYLEESDVTALTKAAERPEEVSTNAKGMLAARLEKALHPKPRRRRGPSRKKNGGS